ncbi:MAG TPA: hypothetical protein PLW66_09505 [Saprospiraceae bacterium]|nr:hypothetical protein [Saprospiraceae bacterium]
MRHQAAFVFVAGVFVFDETCVMKQRRGFDERYFMASNAFGCAQIYGYAQHIQGVMEAVVMKLPGKLRAEFGKDELFGSAIIHAVGSGSGVACSGLKIRLFQKKSLSGKIILQDEPNLCRFYVKVEKIHPEIKIFAQRCDPGPLVRLIAAINKQPVVALVSTTDLNKII